MIIEYWRDNQIEFCPLPNQKYTARASAAESAKIAKCKLGAV
jgi:hypothetical protein